MDSEPISDSSAPSLRSRVVQTAIGKWVNRLIDLGGRNSLLYFRDLRAGTLDLSGADQLLVKDRLLMGRPVRLSQLFAADSLPDAAKRSRTLLAKATENIEERGVKTL